MADQEPLDLRALDASRARKQVRTTRTAPTPGASPDRPSANRGGRAGRTLGRGLLGSLGVAVLVAGGVALVAPAVVAVALGGVAFGVGVVVAALRTARRVDELPDSGGPAARLAMLRERLQEADLAPTVQAELLGALEQLAGARRREVAAEQTLDTALARLDGPGLARALVEAETRGDPEEVELRRRAVEDHAALLARRRELSLGHTRAEAALDALEVALAQATTSAGEPGPSADESGRRLLTHVEALQAAAMELASLEDPPDRDPPPRRPSATKSPA